MFTEQQTTSTDMKNQKIQISSVQNESQEQEQTLAETSAIILCF